MYKSLFKSNANALTLEIGTAVTRYASPCETLMRTICVPIEPATVPYTSLFEGLILIPVTWEYPVEPTVVPEPFELLIVINVPPSWVPVTP